MSARPPVPARQEHQRRVDVTAVVASGRHALALFNDANQRTRSAGGRAARGYIEVRRPPGGRPNMGARAPTVHHPDPMARLHGKHQRDPIHFERRLFQHVKKKLGDFPDVSNHRT